MKMNKSSSNMLWFLFLFYGLGALIIWGIGINVLYINITSENNIPFINQVIFNLAFFITGFSCTPVSLKARSELLKRKKAKE